MDLMGTSGPLVFIIVAIAGYLLGSIPFGLVLTRAFGLGDIRSIGSGNIGATNVLRTGSKKIAIATLAGDLLKGTAAVVFGRYLAGEAGAIIGGTTAFIGHIFPVWLKFKGGKGVATYIGILLGYFWPLSLAFCAVWLAAAIAFRYSSLSALVASVAVVLVAWLALGQSATIVFWLAMLSCLVFATHRANLSRLVAGDEGKISFGSSQPKS